MIETQIPKLLKDSRKASGLKVPEVVRILKDKYDVSISDKTLYGYEVGRSQPEIDCFFHLCDIYGVSPSDIKKEIASDTVYTESEADVQERLKMLTKAFESCGYIAPGEDLSDDQLRFCIGLVDFLDRYFGG